MSHFDIVVGIAIVWITVLLRFLDWQLGKIKEVLEDIKVDVQAIRDVKESE